MKPGLRREIQWDPGYDCRRECQHTPKGEHGICGLRIRWLLHGEQGVVQFLVSTDWLPTEVTEDPLGLRVCREKRPTADLYPMAFDLGHHWSVPTYEGEQEMECDVLPGGRCFYDGSGVRAEHVLGLLIREGHEAVWAYMADEYESLAAQKVEHL